MQVEVKRVSQEKFRNDQRVELEWGWAVFGGAASDVL